MADPSPGPSSAGTRSMASTLRVREMQLAEVGIRIGYFHDASDDDLRGMGVDRALLPSRGAWRASYEADYARPVHERESYLLAWERDGEIVGFSSADQITFGKEAFMHLHILDPVHRRTGMGTEFVRQSAAAYFRVLELRHLYSQPNAFNVAPNRTLQGAGFRYVFTRPDMVPSAINFPQPMTRWVLQAPPA